MDGEGWSEGKGWRGGEGGGGPAQASQTELTCRGKSEMVLRRRRMAREWPSCGCSSTSNRQAARTAAYPSSERPPPACETSKESCAWYPCLASATLWEQTAFGWLLSL